MSRSLVLLSVCAFLVFAIATESRAGLIVEVERYNSDNSKPPVVAGPLKEGARSYTDRPLHCFREIPTALIGAEYIQAANNDKYSQCYQLDITLSEAATLYLFIDDSMGSGWISPSTKSTGPQLNAAGMGWVHEMGFVDTGWNVGMDESSHGRTDRYFSVFKKNVEPGTITLGTQCDLTNEAGRNMYTVAAISTPEPATVALLAAGAAMAIRRRKRT